MTSRGVRRRTALAVGATATALVLAGCANHVERDREAARATAPAPRPAPARVSPPTTSTAAAPVTLPPPAAPLTTAPPTADPGAAFARLSAPRILAAADRATRGVRSAHVVGTTSPADGTVASVDLVVFGSGDCEGTVTEPNGSIEVRVVGDEAFVRPSRAYWRASRPTDAAAIIAELGRRYLRQATETTRFTVYCDLPGLTGFGVPAAYVERGDTTYVGRQPAIRLEVANKGLGVTAALVATTGAHRYLRVETSHPETAVNVDRFDADPAPTAPRQRDVLELEGFFVV